MVNQSFLDLKDEILLAWEKGASFSAIRYTHRIDADSLREALVLWGKPPRTKSRLEFALDRREEIVSEYEKRGSVTGVSKEVGISNQLVKAVLLEVGLL